MGRIKRRHILRCTAAVASLLIFKIYFSTNDMKFEPMSEEFETISNEEFSCPTKPIVTVFPGGRLANHIFQYATAFIVARYLNRSAYLPQAIMETLWPLFDHLTFNTTLEEIMLKCPLTVQLKATPIEDTRTLDQPFTEVENFRSVDVVLPKNLFYLCLVYKHINFFRQQFRLRPEILESVYSTIENVGGTNKTLVGVHVRRSDYGPYLMRVLNESLVNATYFKKAMQFYREKYSEPLLFLIVSDDLKWCEENLLDADDVRIVSASAEHDIALLSACNHTIIDYGTYGVIGAYLSFGHKVMVNLKQRRYYEILKNDAKWTFFDKETLEPI